MNCKVISGFPGVGKSFFQQNTAQATLDSDSSKFSWLSRGVRNPDFPKNYVEHIKNNIEKVDIILVSSHAPVRAALVDNNIPFTLVYPSVQLKNEYIQRYIDRDSGSPLIDLLTESWDIFMTEMYKQKDCEHIVLQSGQYLSDVILEILK